ncbi:MAG: hypothetical protein K2M94_04165 [Paramuribaculum sp.]|nr:hypothetical protein [Paramuribaculum sp.]
MNKLLYLIFVLAAAASVVSCKTSEANYKAAYDIAKKKNTETGDSLIDRSLANANVPKNMTIQGITLPIYTEMIGLTKGNYPDGLTLKRYCIVVGRFAQLFNAQQMRLRMIDNGYPDACLLQNRINQYYVSVETTADVAQAEQLLQKIKNDSTVVLREPFPYVLRPAQLVR